MCWAHNQEQILDLPPLVTALMTTLEEQRFWLLNLRHTFKALLINVIAGYLEAFKLKGHWRSI